MIKLCGIETVAPCNFDGLPLALLIGHMILPALSIPLIFTLIPDAGMNDDLSELTSSFSQATEASQLTSPETPLIRSAEA